MLVLYLPINIVQNRAFDSIRSKLIRRAFTITHFMANQCETFIFKQFRCKTETLLIITKILNLDFLETKFSD